MAERLEPAGTFKRVMEANLRYYGALGQVVSDYLNTIVAIWGDLTSSLNVGVPRPAPATPHSPAPPRSPVLVLEGRAGAETHGAFAVENKLARRASGPVVTSVFRGPSGREVRPPLRVEPSVVTLEPGGRTVVKLIATITEDLEPDVPYLGEATVAGLSESNVPLLLRRSGDPAREPASALGEVSAAKPEPPARPSRRASRNSSPRRKGS